MARRASLGGAQVALAGAQVAMAEPSWLRRRQLRKAQAEAAAEKKKKFAASAAYQVGAGAESVRIGYFVALTT